MLPHASCCTLGNNFLGGRTAHLAQPPLFFFFFFYLECNYDHNKFHSVQVITAASKLVPSSVLCLLTNVCYAYFAFSTLSQEENCKHTVFFFIYLFFMVLFISICTRLCLSDVSGGKVERTSNGGKGVR